MRPFRLLLIFFSFVFVGAALLAPWVYLFLQWTAKHSAIFQSLAESPFHRIVNRCLLFLAVVGLWPFLRALGIRNTSDLGYAPLRSHWKHGACGFAVGFVSLAFIATLALTFGARQIDLGKSIGEFTLELMGAALSAITVAVLEESLFRGALFGALSKSIPWPLALVFSSALYASVHFFGKPTSPMQITWISGLVTMGGMFSEFAESKTFVPQFINLLVAGMILGFAFHCTRNLYFSIGLHAGWIFWLKSYGFATSKISGVQMPLWGSGKLIDGWAVTPMLLFLFGILVLRRPNPKPALNVN